MLDQGLTTLLAAVIGLMAGIVTSYVTQRLSSKSEQGKLIREKCEDLYLLAEQVKLWQNNESERWHQTFLEETDQVAGKLGRKEYPRKLWRQHTTQHILGTVPTVLVFTMRETNWQL